MNRHLFCAIFCAVAALCSIPAAHAEVLVYEGFHAADYGNKTGSNSTTASNGNTTGDYTVGVALGGWSANGTSTVRVTGPANGLALPTVMTDAGFTAVGCAIGMSTESTKSTMKCMYHNLTEGALGVSSGTLYFRMLLAVDPKTAQVLVAGESLAEKDGGYYGFGFGVAPTSDNNYAPTHMNSALSFVIWRKATNQYVLSLVHTTADSTTFTFYPIIDGISPSTTYVCYAEVKVGAGTDGKELIRAGAMAAGDYATSIPWATLDGSSDTVEVELISESSYPTCMAVAGPYGSNGRFRADEIVVGTKLGDVLRADGAFTVAPSGTPTIGQTTFSSDWKLIAGTDVTVDAEIVYSTDSSFATATTNALGTGLSAGTRIASLTGLEPDTTYWWKVSADKSGELNESFAKSFRTTGVPILGEVSAVTHENAITFSAALAEAALGNTLDTTVSIFYGTDGESWTALPLGSSAAAATMTGSLEGLDYGTTYQWFALATATMDGGRVLSTSTATNSFTTLRSGDMFVDAAAENATEPFSTPETAAKTIAAALALATDGATIHVAPGLYSISSQIQVLAGVRIVGTDPSWTIVSNTVNSSNGKREQRVFKINHADALVANLTMQNGSTYSWGVDGGNFLIDSKGGTVSNCIVEASTQSQFNGHAAGGYLKAGLVTHTVFRRNRTRAGSANKASNRCGVLQLEGSAHAENCLFTDNRQTTAVTLINVYGSSVMRNCTIVNSGLSSTNQYCSSWSALNIASGATVQNVVIAGVTNTVDGAACKPTGTRANFVNGALDSSIEGTTFPADTIVGTAESFFKDYANGDYTPKAGGPLVGKGANYEGMASIDLAGNPRKVGSRIDIGCYEASSSALMIIVR